MAKMINLSIKLKQKVASCGSRMQKIASSEEASQIPCVFDD